LQKNVFGRKMPPKKKKKKKNEKRGDAVSCPQVPV
jgi:hypothetical protein